MLNTHTFYFNDFSEIHKYKYMIIKVSYNLLTIQYIIT